MFKCDIKCLEDKEEVIDIIVVLSFVWGILFFLGVIVKLGKKLLF